MGRIGKLVVADTTAHQGTKVPLLTIEGSGWACVPLIGVGDITGGKKTVYGLSVPVVLDTGSQGYWAINSSGERNPLQRAISRLDQGADGVFLRVGTTASFFDIIVPVEDDGPDTPFVSPSVSNGPRVVIAGNSWLRNLVFSVLPEQNIVTFDYLQQGTRTRHPPSVTRSVGAAGGLWVGERILPPFWLSTRNMVGGSLDSSSLQYTPPQRSAGRESSFVAASHGHVKDVAFDIKFEKEPHGLPIMFVHTAKGKKITGVIDTGSGTSWHKSAAVQKQKRACPDPAKGKTIGEAFTVAKCGSPDSTECSCGRCQECNGTNDVLCKRASGCNTKGQRCCSACCTSAQPEGESCDSSIECAILYCTGFVKYSSAILQISNDGHDFDIFCGSASFPCKPDLPLEGLFACWNWKTSSADESFAKGILKSIDLLGHPKLANFSLYVSDDYEPSSPPFSPPLSPPVSSPFSPPLSPRLLLQSTQRGATWFLLLSALAVSFLLIAATYAFWR